ncbi:MAG: acyltransferase family protein [Pseudomonadota bacterium]|nr:acyltransferase family protein [Pseudomonadota bacterium]
MTTADDPIQDRTSASDVCMSAGSSTNEATRRYDLDWLRVFAFGVLIFYHVAMFYTTRDWYLKSRYGAPYLEPVLGLAVWRLALLFFISGAAVRFAIDKATLGEFLPQRITRLFVPLAFGMVVVCAPQTYVELRYRGEIEPGYLAFYRDYFGFGEFVMTRPPWNHLWYVAYILAFTLVAAASLPLLRFATKALAGPFFAWLAKGRAWRLLVVPALPFAVYRFALDPYFPTTLALWGDWAFIVRTFSFFLLGFLAAKNRDFWNAVDRALPGSIVLSLAFGGLLLAAYLNEFAVTADPILFDAFLLLREFYAWSAIVMLLGLARSFANRPSRALTYLTAAIFPYYILHQTITLLVSYWFTVVEAPVAIEVTTIVLVTVLGCVFGYEVIRRVTVLRPLFGLPVRRKSS